MARSPFVEGFSDRYRDGLLWREQLYRRPWWKRALWWAGWLCAWPVSRRSRLSPGWAAATRRRREKEGK